MSKLDWRMFADWAKRRPTVLRAADRLGRGLGRTRVLDKLTRPKRPAIVPDLSNWESQELAACWIGHATVLLRVGGKTIVTDPVWSRRVGLGLGIATAGPARHVLPAIAFRDLPKIDLILSSHAHFDHLDRPTLRRFLRDVPIVCAHQTRDLIDDLNFDSVQELRWGESFDLGEVRITAVPVKHWGARTFHDTHRSFNAYLIESRGPSPARVLFGGDSAYQTHFQAIAPVDLAIVGIGAYDPYVAAHATPEQAWEMAKHADAKFVLPMHHSTFRLSHEPMNEPMQRFEIAAGEKKDKVVVREIGGVWSRG